MIEYCTTNQMVNAFNLPRPDHFVFQSYSEAHVKGLYFKTREKSITSKIHTFSKVISKN